MAEFGKFGSFETDEESSFGSFGSGFGRTESEEVIKPRGSATLGDYFIDVAFTAPARGLGNVVRGLLSIPAFAADFAFDTDTLTKLDNFFEEGFFKIPETETTIGDITATLVQYAIPLSKANKIAYFIPGLNRLGTVTKLDPAATAIDKSLAIVKKGGYFGGIGGLADFAVSVPGVNQTIGEQFGLTEAYQGEDLRGREKAVEAIKSKLKFGAEGATIAGAIPMLPVAGTLGAKYALAPAGAALGYVGNNAIRAINYTVRNPAAKVLSGVEIAGVKVPEIIPNLVKKAQSGMDTVGEGIKTLLPAKDTTFGKLIYGTKDSLKEWFDVYGKVDDVRLFDVRNQIEGEMKVGINNAVKYLENIDDTLQKKLLPDSYQMFESGKTTIPSIKYNQSVLQQYFNTPGKVTSTIDSAGNKIFKYEENETTKKILELLDPNVFGSDVVKNARYIKEEFVKINNNLLKLGVKKDVLENGFEEFIDTSFKQGLASFNNKKFKIDPERKKSVVDLFKNDILLSSTDLRDAIKNRQVYELFGSGDPVRRAITKSEGSFTDEILNAKSVDELNAKYGLNLTIDTFNSYKNKIGSTIVDDNIFKIKDKNGNFEIFNLNKNNIDSFNKKYKTKLSIEQVDNFKRNLGVEAEKRVDDILDATIREGLDSQQIFKNMSDQLGGKFGTVQVGEKTFKIDSLAKLNQQIRNLQKEGGKQPDLSKIVDLLSVPKGATVKIKGKNVLLPEPVYNYGVLDTLVFLNKQRYQAKFFDALLDMSGKQSDLNKKLILSKEEMEIFGRNKENLTKVNSGSLNLRGQDIIKADLLDGTYYAKPEIINAIKNLDVTFPKLMENDFYRGFMKLKSYAQAGGTVFSPIAQVRNIEGNFGFLFGMNLLGGKTSVAQSFKDAFDDVFKGGKLNDKLFREKMDDYLARGIIQDNIQIGEIKKAFNLANKGELDLDSFLNNKITKGFINAYQLGDNAPKMFADNSFQSIFKTAFKAEDAINLKRGTPAFNKFVGEVKDFYQTVLKKEFVEQNYVKGELKTAGEILGDVSAEMVRNLMPTYSMAPKGIRTIRELPIGNFVSFPAEIIRNSKNLVLFGARALTSSNPYIRQMGAHFLIGGSAMLGGAGYVVTKTAQALTGVSEEKMEAYLRSFAPSYQKNSTLVPITGIDQNGNFKYYNFSYTNPYDTIVKPANAVLNAFADGSLRKDTVDKIVLDGFFGNPVTGRKGAIGELLSPFISESIGTERAFDIVFRGGLKREGGRIFYPNDDIPTVMTKSLEHIIGGIVPGAVRSAQRIWEGATGKFTDAGTVRDMATEFTALTTGIRIEDAKPLASMPFIVTSYNKDKQNIDRKFAEIAYRPSATAEQRLDAYRKYLLESFDSQNKMYQVLKDGVTVGIDETDLKDVVQTRLNNKTETKLLFNGVYKVPTYNEKAFDSLIRRLERENSFLATKVESQIEVVKDIYRDLNKEFKNFDLQTPKDEFENILNRTLTPGVREIRRQPQPTLNVLPSSSAPITPGTPFTINTPAVSPNLGATQPNQLSFGERFSILFPGG